MMKQYDTSVYVDNIEAVCIFWPDQMARMGRMGLNRHEMLLRTTRPALWGETAGDTPVRDISVHLFKLPPAEVLTDAGHTPQTDRGLSE
jgi:hypothetical protein